MMDPGAAPDGEEYIAAALLIAARRFNRKDYQDEAISLINAMAHKEASSEIEPMIDRKHGIVRFSPVTGNDFTDPSYHTSSPSINGLQKQPIAPFGNLF